MKETRRCKPRAHPSIEGGVHYAHAMLGDVAVTEITGKSASLVRKWADPDCDTHHIPLFQAIEIDAHLVLQGQPPAIIEATKALIEKKVEALGGAPDHEPAPALSRVIEVFREGTEAVDAYHTALTDDMQISPKAAAEVQTQIDEAIRALQLLAKDVESNTFPTINRLKGA